LRSLYDALLRDGSLFPITDDRYPFGRAGKVGFIDYQGSEVIPPMI